MLTPLGVGFYSDMCTRVFADTSEDVDVVTSPRFLFHLNNGNWVIVV